MATTDYNAISIDVIDPMNRTGKITVPSHYVSETKGLVDFWSGRSATKDLSLCLLFQKGRCNAGGRCHQVHAAPSFVQKLRAQADAGRACCALHGDFQSASFLVESRTVTVTGAATTAYALHSFARTSGLDSVLRGCARVAASKICRLHSSGACKFGKDCKNVHLCRDASAVPAAGQCLGIQGRATELGNEKNAALDQSSSLCGLSTVSSSPSITYRCAPTSSTENSPREQSTSRYGSPPPPLAPLALFHDDAVWSQPLGSMHAASPSSWIAGFESSLSLVAADLAQLKFSPSFIGQ